MAKGFTLIECVLVIGLLAAVAGIGLFGTLSMYRSSSLEDERDLLVALLERARSHALANLYQSSHGVCAGEGRYVVFREPFILEEEAQQGVASDLPPCPEGIVFTAPSATTSPLEITLSNGEDSAVITINREGAIGW